MKKYIFFIRHNNDWDNIAPIIYYLAKSNNSKIYICFYRIDLRDNKVFKFIDEKIGDRIKVFHWTPGKFNKLFNLLILTINKICSKLKIKFQFNQNIYAPNRILTKWIKIMKLHDSKKVIVIFDRTLNPFFKKVKKHLKNLNTFFVSCPHGPMTNVNRMMYTSELERVSKHDRLKHLQFFDYMVFTDYLELEFNEKFGLPEKLEFVNENKVKVLGSLRYCPEWLEHIDKFSPEVVKKRDKIKAVFFMKKFAHNVFIEEVYRTIKVFSSYPDIDFYIVPHSRGMKFSMKNKAPNIFINENLTSSALINLADVIFFYGGTSIVIEPIVKKKMLVCIDYLDSNINIFTYYKACHVLKCRDDLYFFLDSIIQKKAKKIDGEKLLDEIVFGRDKSNSVPEKYINFFNNI